MGTVTKIQNTIEIKRGMLYHHGFSVAMRKALDYPNYGDISTIGSLMSLDRQIDAHVKESTDLRDKAIVSMCDEDPKGTINAMDKIWAPKDIAAWNAEMKKFDDDDLDFATVKKVSYKSMKCVNLSPAELNLLSGVINLPNELSS